MREADVWAAFVDPFTPGFMERPRIEWVNEPHNEMIHYWVIDGAEQKFVNCGYVRNWNLLECELDRPVTGDVALFVRTK